jgi:MoaA/NifB/PqqE/SkfB family radical SAM enzyme
LPLKFAQPALRRVGPPVLSVDYNAAAAMKSASSVFDGQVPPPDFVSIETTMYCNLSCPMCLQFQDGTTVAGPHMSLEAFQRWADQLFPFVTRFQPSVSGEPLLSKGFDQMLDKAAEYGVRLEITCNGTLLNERMRAKLLPVLGKMTISFDGGTKEVFEATRVGAEFEKVRDRVRALCEEAKRMPKGRRPIIELLCVLRRANIRDIVNLVELAHDLGVDMLHLTHMYPPTEELKTESLVYEPEVAIEFIDRALARARELGLVMTVQPLDQVTAASATSGGSRRKYATKDGAVEGLGGKWVNTEAWPPWPPPLPDDHPDHLAIMARRQAARAESTLRSAEELQRPAANWLKRALHGPDAGLPKKIGYCDYLWNKTYVNVAGVVTPCCVPAAPKLGFLDEQRFDEVWNSPQYRRMRVKMALQQPVAFCRGCQHIMELTDPSEIRRALQGRRLPDPKQLGEADNALELAWAEARNALGYEIEFSVDSFATVSFSSSWNGPLLRDNRYEVPDEVWKQAQETSPGAAVRWRAFALLTGENGSEGLRFEVGQGMLDVA